MVTGIKPLIVGVCNGWKSGKTKERSQGMAKKAKRIDKLTEALWAGVKAVAKEPKDDVKIAKRFGIGVSTVNRIRRTGSYEEYIGKYAGCHVKKAAEPEPEKVLEAGFAKITIDDGKPTKEDIPELLMSAGYLDAGESDNEILSEINVLKNTIMGEIYASVEKIIGMIIIAVIILIIAMVIIK